jgi:hypothetical protein
VTLSIMSWRRDTGGYDVHVLRNTTTAPLVGDIVYGERISETAFDWYSTDSTKAAAELEPLEFAVLLEAPIATGAGIAINKATGAVTVTAVTGDLVVHNFLVAARMRLKGATEVIDVAILRVNIHDEVKRCWLTPSLLTTYRGAAGQRFTVLAELVTAGQPGPPLVCDISRLPGIKWTSPTSAAISAKGEITATSLGVVKVKAKLPTKWGGAEAEAEAIVALGWHELPIENTRANLVSGPGFDRLADVPNILLLPEGFTAGQEDDWNTLVRNLVDDLAHTSAYRPFDLFLTSDSVNVWSLFLPSREAGSSVLHEVRAVAGDATLPLIPLVGEAIPRTRFNEKSLDLMGAFARFGLPVRGDVAPDGDVAQRTAFEAKLKDWNRLRATSFPDSPGMFDLWQRWAAWSTRTLIDERDTALGLAFGSRPNPDADTMDRAALYHPFRARRPELDKLLAKVTDGEGPPIGHVWAKGTSTRPGAGKDASLVVAVISGGRSGGVESDRNIASASIHEDNRIRVELVDADGTSARLRPLPHPMPRTWLRILPRIAPRQRGTLVHELAHSFGLADEYVEDEYHDRLIRPGSEPFTKSAGNIMLTKEASDSASTNGDKLVGAKLRWLWPRIAKAGVLTAEPWSSGTNSWVLELRRGHKHQFNNDDVVFLRQRPLRGSVDGKLFLAKVSKPLVVTGDNQVGDQIVVRVQDGSALVPRDWPVLPGRESIVYKPVPAPAYAQARNEADALLVPLIVRDHITETGLPLNRVDAGKCDALGTTGDLRAALLNIPDANRWLVKEQWVGAFDGGYRWACGVIHPAPHCMMRGSSASARFCPVCAYLLVDAVDPSLHGEMDKRYARGYVEPLP